MKKTATLFLFLCGSFFGQAQQCILKAQNGYEYWVLIGDSTYKETPMSKIPEFSGDINKWFYDSIKYPQKAMDEQIQGTVFLTFDVVKDGSVSNLTIVRGVTNSLNEEALRVASKMPKWKPGLRKGRKVKTSMLLWVHFIIRGSPRVYDERSISGTGTDSSVIK